MIKFVLFVLLLLVNCFTISYCFELLSTSSDTAVLAGFLGLLGLSVFDYYSFWRILDARN